MAIKLAGGDVLGVDLSGDTGHWLCARAHTAAADQVFCSPVARRLMCALYTFDARDTVATRSVDT